MAKSTDKVKIQKGDIGYFHAETKRRLLITVVLLAVPLFIFFSSYFYFKTKETIWSIVAIVGCLPACKSLVNLIMLLRAKPAKQEIYEQIKAHAGALLMSYEMYMTFYEKSARIDAFAICGNIVCGYSSDPNIDAAFMEKESQKIIRGNGYKATVKIFTDLKPFLERLDSMNEHKESLEENIPFRPDEKYPELTRNELIKHTILAICL